MSVWVELTPQTTGPQVTSEMFGGHMLYTVNAPLGDGRPADVYGDLLNHLGVNGLRFPGGTLSELHDIIELENGELEAGVRGFLDWARNAGQTVTLVLPGSHSDDPEDVMLFMERLMSDYGDVVGAFEIGNEYWNLITGMQTEIEYADTVNRTVDNLLAAFDALGIAEEDQPDILVSMGTPVGTSMFADDSIIPTAYVEAFDALLAEGYNSYEARSVLANEVLIDSFSEATLTHMDGLVEHFYYNRGYGEARLDGSPWQFTFIGMDYGIWTEALGWAPDLHITEWNVQSRNESQLGLVSASVMLEQMEYMVASGVVQANVWPFLHNMTTSIGGNRATTELDIDPNTGLLTSSPLSTIYNMMAENLPGLSYIETNWTDFVDGLEVDLYGGEYEAVIYVSSRQDEAQTVTLDLSQIEGVVGYEAVKVGIDRDLYELTDPKATSVLTVLSEEMLGPSSAITFDLDAYEVVQIEVELSLIMSGTGGRDKLQGGEGTDELNGKGGADRVVGNSGDDIIYGANGRDKLIGGDGDDLLHGGRGHDVMKGGAGADRFIYTGGRDRIADFSDEDTLVLKLRGEEGLTLDTLAEQAEVTDNGLVLSFGKWSLTLNDVADYESIAAQVEIV